MDGHRHQGGHGRQPRQRTEDADHGGRELGVHARKQRCRRRLTGFRGDELELRDGTRLEGCLVRDEGLRVRMWRTREDFPERSTVFSHDEVEKHDDHHRLTISEEVVDRGVRTTI